ncbi:sulfotransferase family 2 domain-containing protein [Leptobacterium sp. I13]|uniref:sulfotransferase family 2 domain-containing protein n=1 Tax=Leptobacterium meishanense TaxID=3128904 RepID=UPI0030ED9662
MISREYKCIYIHIPKCGGTSIQEKFLVNQTKSQLLLGKNKDPKKGPPRLNHLMASEYVSKKHISQEDFSSYFKFTFVRNPWARVFSMYKYLGYSQFADFDTFVTKIFKKELWDNSKWFWFVRPQYDFIHDSHGNMMVDYVGRTEVLNEDFKKVCQKIGLEDNILSHINKSSEKSRYNILYMKTLFSNPYRIFKYRHGEDDKVKDHRDYYTNNTIEIIYDFYRIDIETFGYSF